MNKLLQVIAEAHRFGNIIYHNKNEEAHYFNFTHKPRITKNTNMKTTKHTGGKYE